MKRFSLRGAQSVVKRKGTEMPPDKLDSIPILLPTVSFINQNPPLKKNVPQLILAPSVIAIIFVCLIFQRFFPFSALTVRKCETKIRVPVVSDRIPLILFLANT